MTSSTHFLFRYSWYHLVSISCQFAIGSIMFQNPSPSYQEHLASLYNRALAEITLNYCFKNMNWRWWRHKHAHTRHWTYCIVTGLLVHVFYRGDFYVYLSHSYLFKKCQIKSVRSYQCYCVKIGCQLGWKVCFRTVPSRLVG